MMKKTLAVRVAAMLIAVSTPPVARAVPAIDDLRHYSPALADLYERNPSAVPALRQYAIGQGFTDPHEQLAVIVHELIHIESARVGAYWVGGRRFEGYQASAWPNIVGHDLHITPAEREDLGGIYDNYLRRNPMVTLRNVVDELNAYSQTAGFVCLNTPARSSKQTQPLLGHLALANAFLKAYTPSMRQAVCADKIMKGILALVVSNSYKTLSSCEIYAVGSQDAIRACLR